MAPKNTDVVWLTIRGRLGCVRKEFPALRLPVTDLSTVEALGLLCLGRVSVLSVFAFPLACVLTLALVLTFFVASCRDGEHQPPKVRWLRA